jgi:tRNA 2-thiouridine synthesizing protein A
MQSTMLDPNDDDDDLDPATLSARTLALQQRLEQVARQPCRGCGAGLCGHGAVLAVVFGCQHAPRCVQCLAAEHGEAVPAIVARARQWIVRRDCFLHVWRAAGEREGNADQELPGCLVPVGTPPAVVPASAPVVVADRGAPSPTAVAHYDAGDLGCGDLVLELRFRLADLPPGAVLQVTARDPAAPIDLPAWCGLCGHSLLHAEHPDYWIRRRDRA